MSNRGMIKTFGIIIFVGILLLIFFQNNILTNLIDPIRNVSQKIIVIFPVILGIFAGIFFIGGLLNRRRRLALFILAGIYFIVSVLMTNPSFLSDLSSIISGNPPSPIGWH